MYSDISEFGHLFKVVLGKIAFKMSGKLKNANYINPSFQIFARQGMSQHWNQVTMCLYSQVS